jgi:hypothetical protein
MSAQAQRLLAIAALNPLAACRKSRAVLAFMLHYNHSNVEALREAAAAQSALSA